MKKILIYFYAFLVSISTFIFYQGCDSGKNDIFFLNLKDKKIDMKISEDRYFIKSFGINATPTIIMNDNYWKLNDDIHSYFYLEGYLKNDGDSITILPVNYNFEKNNIKAYKLFDFTLNKPKSWKLFFKLDSEKIYGDSVCFLKKEMVNNDIFYSYSITGFTYLKKIKDYYFFGNNPTFNIVVSRTNGIVSISLINDINQSIDYEAKIYPIQKFTNNHRNLIDL